MKTEKEELSIEQKTVRDCPILYRMSNRSMTETCMCWGWEHNHGWDRVTEKMSRKLEVLNTTYYPKYRVRIQMDQIKEKFGEFRGYYSIVVDPCKFVTWVANKFDSLYQYLSNNKRFNYNLEKIVDQEPFDYDEKKELTKKEYEDNKKNKYKASNVEYVKDGEKYFEVIHLRNYGKFHMEPTKHKILWKLKNYCNKKYHTLMWVSTEHSKPVTRNIIAYMEYMADKIIREAEEECYRTCEICGHQIGTEWSPTCTTMGWITNICEDCAKKQESNYTMNGKVYNKGIEVKKSKKSRK